MEIDEQIPTRAQPNPTYISPRMTFRQLGVVPHDDAGKD
jgi:hypothetical protein